MNDGWTPANEARLAALEAQVADRAPLTEYDQGALAALERGADPAAAVRIDALRARAERVAE
ncbi:MAG: hypothetical protein R2720_07770 [Candidatus Nanopelagicales bacterium]